MSDAKLQSHTGFEVLIENDELREALKPAFDAAQRAAAESGCGDQRGAIFCQIFAPSVIDSQNQIRIKGAFIERKYAERLGAILEERMKEIGDATTGE